jgi:hypothetical protein
MIKCHQHQQLRAKEKMNHIFHHNGTRIRKKTIRSCRTNSSNNQIEMYFFLTGNEFWRIFPFYCRCFIMSWPVRQISKHIWNEPNTSMCVVWPITTTMATPTYKNFTQKTRITNVKSIKRKKKCYRIWAVTTTELALYYHQLNNKKKNKKKRKKK